MQIKGIERLNNQPREYDLSKFTLIAECVDGELSLKEFQFMKEEKDVYAMQFNDDLYIGSTSNIYRRVHQHNRLLITKKHTSKRMQSVYDKCRSFKVYILMRCIDHPDIAENMFIRLLRPSLNIILPKGKTEWHNDIVWATKPHAYSSCRCGRRASV